jgi:hypothetical protein
MSPAVTPTVHIVYCNSLTTVPLLESRRDINYRTIQHAFDTIAYARSQMPEPDARARSQS